METNEITKGIIGCAIEVHKNLGPGLLESAYEECLLFELSKSEYEVKRQVGVPVKYKEIKLDCGYRMDLLVEETVVLELKVVEGINDVHIAQLLTYMKFSGKKVGLLINFNVLFLKSGIRRFVL